MADLSFNGFYFIEGDTTYGFIGRTLSYDKNIANPESGEEALIRYPDIIAKFQTPVILTRNTGVYNTKFILEENEEETRKNINTGDEVWKNIFSIANYIYHKFYSIANNTNGVEWHDSMISAIDSVLSGRAPDPSINSVAPFRIYVSGSVDVEHAGSQISTLFKKIKLFKFDIREGDVVYHMTMWVNPEFFVQEWESQTERNYVFFNKDNELTTSEFIDEIQGTVKNKDLYYKNWAEERIHVKETIEVEGQDPVETEVDKVINFYLFSTVPIENDITDSNKWRTLMQQAVVAKETELDSKGLSVKYYSLFGEVERVIYPLVDNTSIDQLDQSNLTASENLVVQPIDITKINTIIGNLDKSLTSFESATILVGKTYIPFIIGSSATKSALTDKIPYFRPTVEQIQNIGEDYDQGKITNAIEFNKALAAVINYQINGVNIPNTVDVISRSDSFIVFKYLGIQWKVFNRTYNPDNLTEEPATKQREQEAQD